MKAGIEFGVPNVCLRQPVRADARLNHREVAHAEQK